MNLPSGLTPMANTGGTNGTGYHDFLPFINVGAALGQLTGKDGDVFPGISVRGGERTTNNNAFIGPTNTGGASGTWQPIPSVTGGGNDGGSQNTGGGSYYTGGGGSIAAAPAYDPAQVAQFDQALSVLNNALGRLPSQLDVARGNVNTQYGTNLNELNSNRDQAQHSFDTSTTQNQQQYRTNKNQIADQASAGLSGLMRLLGAYGAGGGSDAQFVAPQAVATQASQQRAGAGQAFAQNQQGLETNFNNFLGGFDNSKRQLEDWKTQQLNSAEAQSAQNKQDLLSKLADLTGKKAAYMGGSYTGAAQPFIDQANGLSGQIDNLGRLNPTYTGTTPVFNAPSLSSYVVNAGGAPQAGMNAAQDAATPYLSLLLGQQKDKKNA